MTITIVGQILLRLVVIQILLTILASLMIMMETQFRIVLTKTLTTTDIQITRMIFLKMN